MIASSVVQLIPCVDVIGSILCYMMFRKDDRRMLHSIATESYIRKTKWIKIEEDEL